MEERAGIRQYITELLRPGETEMSNQALLRFTRVALTVVLVTVNLIGAAAVIALLVFNVVPEPHIPHLAHWHLVYGLAAAAYVMISVPLGHLLGLAVLRSMREWLNAARPPTPKETRVLLTAPLRLYVMQLTLWLIAAALFSVLNIHISSKLALNIAIVTALTGFVTASLAYLAAERLLRSVAARVLKDGSAPHVPVPGVITRTLLAWGLGTGLPVLGLMSIGIRALAGDPDIDTHNLGIAIVVLAATAIVVGWAAMTLAARTTSDPIRSVVRALADVQRGDFTRRVPVYDGSEIGQLQLGFNEMVTGLAERERIREAFGTYVDPEVAARIIDEGVDLSGEQVDVTCMFVDIRGFTTFAERNSAADVVTSLNELFNAVVPVIHDHGGRVDKFIGDGLLAVFGAPRRMADHADRAFSSALEIERTVATAGQLQIGVGLNSGPVVAGNVGGAGRLEFSVIGDTVNVAARVESATRQTGDVVLISEHTRARLTAAHPLTERAGVTLKGKSESVRVYAPTP
jgi:adenylate cyclase